MTWGRLIRPAVKSLRQALRQLLRQVSGQGFRRCRNPSPQQASRPELRIGEEGRAWEVLDQACATRMAMSSGNPA